MGERSSDEEFVDEVVGALRKRLLKAVKEGKEPYVDMSIGFREKPGLGGFVEKEPDGSWNLRVSIPPDPAPVSEFERLTTPQDEE